MGRVYEKVMENRKHLASILMENIQSGSLLGERTPEQTLRRMNITRGGR